MGLKMSWNQYLTGLFAAVQLLVLSGCIPIPWKRKYLKQPELTICASDSIGRIKDASVYLTRRLVPHGADSIFSFTTGTDGCVYLKRKIERETVMPLMMHGVHEYNFSLLVKTEHDSTLIYCWQWTRDVSVKDDIQSYFEYRYDSLKVKQLDSTMIQVKLN